MKNLVMKTTWKSSNNVGRRFLGCSDWCEDGHSDCNFFTWVDTPMYKCSRVVILGLIRRLENVDAEIKGLKDELKECKDRARCAWGLLIVTWIFIFNYMFVSTKDEIP